MSEKSAKAMRRVMRDLLSRKTGSKNPHPVTLHDNVQGMKEMAKREHLRRSGALGGKINMKKLKRRRKSMMAQLVRAAERRGRIA